MSWPALSLPMVLQDRTDTELHTSLPACFEIDAHDSPVVIKKIELIGIHKIMMKIMVKIMKIIDTSFSYLFSLFKNWGCPADL
jgi:hypothetical protein